MEEEEKAEVDDVVFVRRDHLPIRSKFDKVVTVSVYIIAFSVSLGTVRA